jgi:hypothetical protein
LRRCIAPVCIGESVSDVSRAPAPPSASDADPGGAQMDRWLDSARPHRVEPYDNTALSRVERFDHGWNRRADVLGRPYGPAGCRPCGARRGDQRATCVYSASRAGCSSGRASGGGSYTPIASMVASRANARDAADDGGVRGSRALASRRLAGAFSISLASIASTPPTLLNAFRVRSVSGISRSRHPSVGAGQPASVATCLLPSLPDPCRAKRIIASPVPHRSACLGRPGCSQDGGVGDSNIKVFHRRPPHPP